MENQFALLGKLDGDTDKLNRSNMVTFNRVRQKESEKIAAILKQIYLDIAKRTNDIIENIVKMTSDLFQVELKPFAAVEQLSKKGEFYLLLKDIPGAKKGIPRLLLPASSIDDVFVIVRFWCLAGVLCGSFLTRLPPED